MENPIKLDDLGVPLFLETPIWNNKLAYRAIMCGQFILGRLVTGFAAVHCDRMNINKKWNVCMHSKHMNNV